MQMLPAVSLSLREPRSSASGRFRVLLHSTVIMKSEALQQISQEVRKTFPRTRVQGQQRGSKGIVALFSGPSGTGKTLAAESLAKDLGTSVQRMNLGKISQQYIGETEKNLARFFDVARTKRAVLLFDEADALFGKRTHIQDSHNRYANQEISHLLTQIESYPGLVILSTNKKENIDPRILKRLKYIVTFPPPKPR